MARMAVGDTELRAMLRIVNAPDDADDSGPLPRSVLAALARLFGADAVHFFRLDVERCATPLYQEYGQLDEVGDEDVISQVFWSLYWSSPFCSYPDRTGDVRSVTKASDFHTMTELRRTEMWRDYLRSYGVHREMMLCLPSPPLRTLRLLLSRGPGPDFSERDRALLVLLRPHLDARLRGNGSSAAGRWPSPHGSASCSRWWRPAGPTARSPGTWASRREPCVPTWRTSSSACR